MLTHHTILGKVWGREYLDATNYLKVYIRPLRQKLEADPANPMYILTERSIGYKIAKPE